jgi:hypothetical protein
MAETEQMKKRIQSQRYEQEAAIRREQKKQWDAEATQAVREVFGEGKIKLAADHRTRTEK